MSKWLLLLVLVVGCSGELEPMGCVYLPVSDDLLDIVEPDHYLKLCGKRLEEQ